MKESLTPPTHKSNCEQLEAEQVDLVSHAEGVILEALVIDPGLIDQHKIKASYFHNKDIQSIFKAINSIVSDGLVLELDMLAIKLTEQDNYTEGRLDIFEQLKKWGNVSQNFDYYFGLLKEREFGQKSSELIVESQLGSDSPAKKAGKLIESMSDLVAKYAPRNVCDFDSDWDAVCNVAMDAANGVFPFGLKTHFPKLDKLLGEGILEDYLCVLGADPGAGKTTFALNLAKNIAMYDKYSTAYISFEMGRTRLMRWYMSACTSIPFAQFMDGTLTDADIESFRAIKRDMLPPKALEIIECETDIKAVVREIRVHVKKHPNCKLIIVDHLHRLTWAKSANSVEVQSAVTGALKDIAIETKVPILLLAHLVKAGKDDKMESPKPELIKGSGTVIADADMVIIARMAPSVQQVINKRVVNMYVVKNRGGRADGAFTQILNIPGTAVMLDHENVVRFMN